MEFTSAVRGALRRLSVRNSQLSHTRFKTGITGLVFALTLAGAFAATDASATPAVGAIVGAGGVNSQGAATYNVPITMPPGTHGMQPAVALTYNSQSGEGAAGYGWTLSGLSAITRCAKTLWDNGMTEGVQLTSNSSYTDDFCLDGQRLRLISGVSGADGATYGTEIEGFSLITSHGSSGTGLGPSYFTVQSKDGRVYEYGNTTDSMVLAQGTSAVRVWALDKVTDLNGNYMTYQYQQDAADGDYWIQYINYTGNSGQGTTPDHQVEFDWNQRSANTVQARYLHGSLITQTRLLSAIKVNYTRSPGSTTFTYSLSYMNPAPPSGRNLLTSVKECGADGTCFSPTNIGWQTAQTGWQGDQPTGVVFSSTAYATAAHLMDVDGDGIQDLVFPDMVPGGGGTIDWCVMFGQPAGGFSTLYDTGIPADPSYFGGALAFNYDGSGRMGLLVPLANNGVEILAPTGVRANGSGGIFRTPPNNLSIPAGDPVWTADYSGRGLDDIIYSDGTYIYLIQNNSPTSQGTFAAPQNIYTIPNSSSSGGLFSRSTSGSFVDTPVDFDGSGRGGAITLKEVTKTCNTDGCQPPPPVFYYGALNSIATSTATPPLTLMGSTSTTTGMGSDPYILDALGDGLSDIYVPYNDTTDGEVAISTGTGFVNVHTTGVFYSSFSDPLAGDYYGDGRQELFIQTSAGAWQMVRVNYTPGSGFSVAVNNVAAPIPSNEVLNTLRVGSITANGLSDLVYAVATSATAYEWDYNLHAAGTDLVTSVTDGLGNSFQPAYSTLSSGASATSPATGPLYGIGNTATYPVQDVQWPMTVVSSYKATNGIGATYSMAYTYLGAQNDLNGRGFLGFHALSVTDNRSSNQELLYYDQTFPLIGRVTDDIHQITGNSAYITISAMDASGADYLQLGSVNNTRYLPFFDQTTVHEYDPGSVATGIQGKEIRRAVSSLATSIVDPGNPGDPANHVSSTSYDAYGNVLDVTGQVTDLTQSGNPTFTSDTVTHFNNDYNTSTYCVGLPTSVTVTKTPPPSYGPAISRTLTNNVDTGHCRAAASGSAATPSITETSSEGNSPSLTSSYLYDGFGNVSQTVISGTNVSSTLSTGGRTGAASFSSFCPASGLSAAIGPNGEFAVQSTMQVSGSLALCSSTAWRYDLGVQTQSADPNGHVTAAAYDGYGRITSVQSADGTSTTYNYQWCGSGPVFPCTNSAGVYEIATTEHSGSGVAINGGYSVYDMRGRVVEQGRKLLGGGLSKTWMSYDAYGQLISVSKPFTGASPQFSGTYGYWNQIGKPHVIDTPLTPQANCTSPCQNVTTYSYSGLTTTVSTTAGIAGDLAEGATKASSVMVDAVGETTQTVDYKYGVTSYAVTTYGYDAFGDLLTTTDADGHQTVMTYDGLGHKTTMAEPNLGSWTYAVDALGETLCETDANGQSKLMAYDNLGRLASRMIPVKGSGCNVTYNPTQFWTYDGTNGLGLPSGLSDSISGYSKAVTYDNLSRLADSDTTIGGVDYQVSATYDSFGRVSTVTYPASATPSGSSMPVAVPVASPSNLTMGGTVTLNGAGSTDPNGLPLQYSWSQASGPAQMNLSDPDESSTGFTTGTPGNYSFNLMVSDADALSTPASVGVSVSPQVPAAPGVPSGTNTSGGYSVTWTQVAGADSYKLYESSNGTTYSLLATVAGGSTVSYGVSGHSNGTYYYELAACGNSACSANSAASSGETVLLPPPAPTGLGISPAISLNGGFSLSWTAVAGATGYQVYQSNGGSYTLVNSPTGTSYSPSGLANAVYSYYVKACNASCGASSSTVSGTVLLPPTVNNTSLGISTNGSFALNWNGVSTANGYQVYESNGGSYTKIAAPTANSYTASGLANGNYSFYVVACLNTTCTGQSPTLTGTVMLPPTGLGIAKSSTDSTGHYSSNGIYTLSWNGVPAATQYRIFQSSGGAYTWIDTVGTQTSRVEQVASNGTWYYYVEACNGSVCTGQSNVASVGVQFPPTAPGVTASPGVISPGGTSEISWWATSSPVSYFQLTRLSNVLYTGSGSSFYVTLQVTKSYNVQACNTSGCSPSSPITVTVNQGTGFVMPPRSPAGSDAPLPGAPGGASDMIASSAADAPVATIVIPAGHGEATSPDATAAPNRSVLRAGASLAVASVTRVAAPQSSDAHEPDANHAQKAGAKPRQLLAARPQLQSPEAVFQAMADRRAEAALPSILPPAPAADVAAWQDASRNTDPAAPLFAPPVYIAYAGAKIKPATNPPYRFAVQYNYDDPVSGALVSVQNQATGFVYWEAESASSEVAPVDAWGHLLGYTDGNNVTTAMIYDQATGAVTGISSGVGTGSGLQQLYYAWDGFGNLSQRCDANQALLENFSYDGLNRLAGSQVYTGVALGSGSPACSGGTASSGPQMTVSYDPVGNIQAKTNPVTGSVASYSYNPANQQITSISGIAGTFSYDNNGNMTAGSGRAMTWNADNLATCIDSTGGTCSGGGPYSQFSYGPDQQRYLQSALDASGNSATTAYVAGGLFEVVSNSAGTQYRHTIMVGGNPIAVHTITSAGAVTTDYLHPDHLGGISVITNDSGSIATDPVTGEQEIMSFDAFGYRRDPGNWSYDLTSAQVAGLKAQTDRGYTYQEQLDNVSLVHMNGRIYDPAVGRMLSPDPTVAQPFFSQGLNRYAYAYNNPLAYVDPSGYMNWGLAALGTLQAVGGAGAIAGGVALIGAGIASGNPFAVVLGINVIVTGANQLAQGWNNASRAEQDATTAGPDYYKEGVTALVGQEGAGFTGTSELVSDAYQNVDGVRAARQELLDASKASTVEAETRQQEKAVLGYGRDQAQDQVQGYLETLYGGGENGNSSDPGHLAAPGDSTGQATAQNTAFLGKIEVTASRFVANLNVNISAATLSQLGLSISTLGILVNPDGTSASVEVTMISDDSLGALETFGLVDDFGNFTNSYAPGGVSSGLPGGLGGTPMDKTVYQDCNSCEDKMMANIAANRGQGNGGKHPGGSSGGGSGSSSPAKPLIPWMPFIPGGG